MEDLDFVTEPEKKTVYDPDVARAFFKSCGTVLEAVKGTILFVEQSQGDKIYFIAAGEVALSLNGKNIDISRTEQSSVKWPPSPEHRVQPRQWHAPIAL